MNRLHQVPTFGSMLCLETEQRERKEVDIKKGRHFHVYVKDEYDRTNGKLYGEKQCEGLN